MKISSKRLRKTESRAKLILSSFLLLPVLISCTKESLNVNIPNEQSPSNLIYNSSILLDVPQFLPQKLVCDIKENIFVLGNRRRLILINQNKKIEEISLESIYPCEIVDIATDGFDIFLLDRKRRKIWTVKRGRILEKGFDLGVRPLLFGVSEKEQFTIIYSNRREFYTFSKTEKKLSSFLLEDVTKEGDRGGLLFRKNNIYFANTKKDRVEIYYQYAPAKKTFLEVKSPYSLAVDALDNLFVVGNKGVISVTGNLHKRTLFTKEISMAEIFINKDRLYLLNPEKRKIDVFKIIYNPSGIPGRE